MPTTADHRTRALRYRDAMGDLSRRFPEDPEAAIFHALAILGAASPTDREHAANRSRRRRSSPPGWFELPNHPGHHPLFDPRLRLAGARLSRARCRAALRAHRAGVGRTRCTCRRTSSSGSDSGRRRSLRTWTPPPPSTRSPRASAPAARRSKRLHALDYLEYGYLQIGDDVRARAGGRAGRRRQERERSRRSRSTYGLIAIPARFALERRQWAEAAALKLPTQLEWTGRPCRSSRPIHSYAQALGAAAIGDLAAAGAAVERLAEQQRRPRGGAAAGALRLGDQRRGAAARCRRSPRAGPRGNSDAALDLLRAGADLDDKAGKHPVTPGTVLPQRELLADLLLELGRPREALREYEASLRGRAEPPARPGRRGAGRRARGRGRAGPEPSPTCSARWWFRARVVRKSSRRGSCSRTRDRQSQKFAGLGSLAREFARGRTSAGGDLSAAPREPRPASGRRSDTRPPLPPATSEASPDTVPSGTPSRVSPSPFRFSPR